MAEMLDGTGMPVHGGSRGGRGGMQGEYRGHGPMNGGGGHGGGNRANGYDEGPSNILRLRGLPFSAQKDDIVRWFEDVQITPITADR